MEGHDFRSVPALIGVRRLAPISGLSAPSATGLELRPLPSAGITRRRRYYEPLRHPMRPGLSLAGVRLSPRDPPRGASRVASVPPSGHAVVITPVGPLGRFARGPAYSSLALVVTDDSLPRVTAVSAPTSLVSRPARRSLALRPARSPDRHAARCLEGSDGFVTSTAAPIASGWSDPVAGGHGYPWESETFHGAHRHQFPLVAAARLTRPSPFAAALLLGTGRA